MKDPRSDHTMKWTRAKLVPFTNEDGSVSTYDVVTNTIVLEHIIGPHQGKRFRVPLQSTLGTVKAIVPSEYTAFHYHVDPLFWRAESDPKELRAGELAVIIHNVDQPNYLEDAMSMNANGLLSGARNDANEGGQVIGGKLVITKNGDLITKGMVAGSAQTVSEAGTRMGMAESHAGITVNNFLNFLPSFAFLPLPKVLPSLAVVEDAAGVAKQLKDAIAALKELT